MRRPCGLQGSHVRDVILTEFCQIVREFREAAIGRPGLRSLLALDQLCVLKESQQPLWSFCLLIWEVATSMPTTQGGFERLGGRPSSSDSGWGSRGVSELIGHSSGVQGRKSM